MGFRVSKGHLEALYSELGTKKAIAKRLDVSETTIDRHFTIHGIKTKEQWREARPLPPQEELQAMVLQHGSIRATAIAMGWHPQTLTNRIHEAKYYIHSPKVARRLRKPIPNNKRKEIERHFCIAMNKPCVLWDEESCKGCQITVSTFGSHVSSWPQHEEAEERL